MKLTLEEAISKFGSKAKDKLANPSTTGRPEDQLRSPFEQLLADVSDLIGISSSDVIAVDESPLTDLKTRPDYSVTVKKALVGFVELKAPGKGADPRKFKDAHDREQWEKLRFLPNLIYIDGYSFSLWRDGELVDKILTLEGEIESSGSKLKPVPGLLSMFENFLRWNPIPPKNARELAETTARLCRLLRDEVTEQLTMKSEVLTSLAKDWRQLLFPEANDERFADGYAQAVVFGMLMARAKNIDLSLGLDQAAKELSKTSSLIGTALRLLTDDAENQNTLKTALGTLIRVIDAVDWAKISKGKPEAWLYFYEDFLQVYDNELRKLTGSYYTPPEVVAAMVNLVDEVLKTDRFGQHRGLASPAVTIADPATGTGTFLLGVLRRIADAIAKDEGAGAVKGAIQDCLKRIIGFEIQLGPFAVAQLRMIAEVLDLTKTTPAQPVRLYVTDTLGNPHGTEGHIPSFAKALGESRKQANRIKRDEPITVVLGNPPYKVKAKEKGGWVESGAKNSPDPAPLLCWLPPAEWHLGAHTKHLYNLYIYFWRWATWKVYDHHPGSRNGVICFITVAGFLSGRGFEKMRDYLRRTCDDIWVIDCSPEGYQPSVNTRVFEGVQQPVCIVLASRSSKAQKPATLPAKVLFRALEPGHREQKFEEMQKLTLATEGWIECPSDWRTPFLPYSQGEWSTYPLLQDLFIYSGSGVMPGRTWVIAPDSDSLLAR
jgi:hypothetical protein